MKKGYSIILGVVGGILALIGGIIKHAYSTGHSYFVTAAEQQATVSKAGACIWIGIALCVLAVIFYIRGHKKN